MQFKKQSIHAQGEPVSFLSSAMGNMQLKDRRSSVLRRMSVGFQADAETLKLDIHRGTTTTAIESDDEDEENDEDIAILEKKTCYSSLQEDEELYKRSNSNTPACKIDDFKPLRVLGQGAYGKVLLVKNKNTSKLFAQKELKKASIIMNTKNIERTLSERTILSKITSHQNIVKLFYALHDNSKLYLLMEYIPGGELFKYLVQEKFLTEKKTCFYVIQMATALKFLHKFGIVYRDLKPENCMLDKDGYLILTDFGLAKKSSDEDNTDTDNWCNSIIGTPEYCAPEVLKGENYGYPADWWSLGCVTYDLLTGNPPFIGNNHKKIMERVVTDKPKYPFYVTTTSIEILNKLLNKNPNKRFDVDTEWEKFQKFQFFRHYKFRDIENRIVEPPIKPVITDLELAENFDTEFTNMKLSDLNDKAISITKIDNYSVDDQFNGFSYTASKSFVENYS